MLAAPQDIAVDGLALTALSPRNRELAATCNAIGQSAGYLLAYAAIATVRVRVRVSVRVRVRVRVKVRVSTSSEWRVASGE